MIKIEQLQKSYGGKGGVYAVNDVSLEINAGEMVTLLGPSGCGKTTTLRCIAGLERPTGGRISIDGTIVAEPGKNVFVPPHQRNLGMVFQSYAIWPHMTVLDNVAYALEGRGMDKKERHRLAQEALEVVRLGHLSDRPAPRLSGGQQQRVAIARALVARPKALLFDEPLSNLDAQLRGEMRAELVRLQRQVGLTSVFVTHDQAEALAISDWIVVLKDGHVVEYGRPTQIYREPRHIFTARFVGNTNLVPGTVESVDRAKRQVAVTTELGRFVGLDTVGDLNAGDKVEVSMRPEDLLPIIDNKPRVDGNRIEGIVEFAMFAGSVMEVDARCGDIKLQCLLGRGTDPTPGSAISLEILPEACVVLRSDGAKA